jgi:hypothetical protein
MTALSGPNHTLIYAPVLGDIFLNYETQPWVLTNMLKEKV